MYQPALRPDQVTALYYLKKQRRLPMTRLLREAVDLYLATHSEQLEETLRRETSPQQGARHRDNPARGTPSPWPLQ